MESVASLVFITVLSSSLFQDQTDDDDDEDECKDERRRRNHTVLERQRRSEQRTLFDRLQVVLQSDPRAPRLRLLALVSSTPDPARI